ncbi:MAG: hypothetical protein Q8N00_01645 [Nitrospirota bacterium]|nr:hypothetical protein [Nitrospirota bacterium]
MMRLALTTDQRAPRMLKSEERLRAVPSVICWILLLTLLGCTSSREIIPLEVRQGRPMLKKSLSDGQRFNVAVMPFEDQRADSSRIGIRRDWRGDETTFTIEGGRLGDILAEMFVDYLKQREGWNVWIVKPGIVPPDGGPDVTLSGMVVAFSADAEPGFGVTDMTVTARFLITGQHPVDQRSAVVMVDAIESSWAFGFEPRDLEALLNATLRKDLEQFMSQVVVEGRRLRLK